jgi:hypothetical protein
MIHNVPCQSHNDEGVMLCKQLCDAGICLFTPASIMCHFRITSSLLYMFDSSLSCELPLSLCYCSSSVTLTRLGIWSLYYRVGLAGELSSNVFIFIICQFFVGLSYHYTTVTWYVSIMLMPSMALFFIWQWRSLLIIPYRSWVVTKWYTPFIDCTCSYWMATV